MTNSQEIQALICVAEHCRDAREELLQRFRGRLRQMIAVRLDKRILARIDPSDVIQETFVIAHRRFDDYFSSRPVAFYPWLRRLAWERVLELHDRHVRAEKRSVLREKARIGLPDESAMRLVDRVARTELDPASEAIRQEARRRLREGLDQLPDTDRDVLVLRFLEEMSLEEVAEVLGISQGAVSMRQLRALMRLKQVLGDA